MTTSKTDAELNKILSTQRAEKSLKKYKRGSLIMTLSNQPTQEELEKYLNWTTEAAEGAKSAGMIQKSHYFAKRKNWAAQELEFIKLAKKVKIAG